MTWVTNVGVEINETGTWIKLPDHGRGPIDVSVEQIENKQRMANGTMRLYSVAKKRTFALTWENLPSQASSFLANGDWAADDIESFYNRMKKPVQLRLRRGSDIDAVTITRTGDFTDADYDRIFLVRPTDFSKTIVKRFPTFDLCTLNLSFEEV